jgi:hypothetical protein
MTPAFKQQLIKERMKSINVSHRSYFIKNETNIRLCHLEDGEYKYLVFPFCDYKGLTTAAQILKEARIVDGYRVEKLNESQFYVALIRNKLVRHVDASGVPEIVMTPKVVEWSELFLTRDDAKQFIATFQVNNSEEPTTPRHTPVMQMVPRQIPAVIQFEPYRFYKAA